MIKWHELFFQGVKQIWNNICVISLKTYPKKCKKPRSLTVKSLTSFYGWSCCKIQRNNFTHQRNNYFDSTNYLYIQQNSYLYIQRNNYFDSTNYLHIQQNNYLYIQRNNDYIFNEIIIYVFTKIIIFIQQIIYTVNEIIILIQRIIYIIDELFTYPMK